WRAFEETNFVPKPVPSRPKKASSPSPKSLLKYSASPTLSEDTEPSPDIQHLPLATNSIPIPTSTSMHLPHTSMIDPTMVETGFVFPVDSDGFMGSPNLTPVNGSFEPSSVTSTNTLHMEGDHVQDETTAPSSITGQSPRLQDLLLPGTDLSVPPPEYFSFRSQFPEELYQPAGFSLTQNEMNNLKMDPDVEEIVRQDMNPEHESWALRLASPTSSNSSSGSSEGGFFFSGRSDSFSALCQEIQMPQDSAEMLTLRFDRQTCGILSVMDGPTENPWRTLIWPLARDSPALYHAIASMTSFHISKSVPAMRVHGIEHVHNSLEALRAGIANMRIDGLETAIATTLTLAFSESWDQHISTGINHIKGAKTLVSQALTQHRRSPFHGEKLQRMQFLCNTWVYMDVIARLTSVDDNDDSNDFDAVFTPNGGRFDEFSCDSSAQLDPLMGCAGTLFPLIGRVANVVRKVRRCSSNSPKLISDAMELKARLEQWMPPAFFEPPEDPSTQIMHSLQTAEAYRWATLLYLHQAVPEIPSLSSPQLAKKVLIYLATVPLTSRAVIVHIFPLIAAGAEASGEEDRQWVRDRWNSMACRMGIGVIDRCADVVQEVWRRRDDYQSASLRKSVPVSTSMLRRGFTIAEDEMDSPDLFGWGDCFGGGGDNKKRRAASFAMDERPCRKRPRKSSADAVTGAVDPEFTVRGKLHWLGVMKDWNWEVLLG
ncbi:hypothetical protein LTS18_005219, partial [Coniosporium uncinatum]